MKSFFTSRLPRWGLVFLGLLFVFTSFQTLLTYKNASYDLDELYSYDYARNIDFSNLPKYLDEDPGNPPLYFVLLRFWLPIVSNEFSARFLSFIFYSLSFVLVLKIARQLGLSRGKVVLAGGLFLGMYFEAPIIPYLRPYALLSLFTLLTVWLSLASHKNASRFVWALPATVVLGFLTHYLYWVFCAFWLAAQGVVWLVSRRSGEMTLKAQRYFLLGLLCIAPFIVHLLFRETFSPGLYEFEYQFAFPWAGPSLWLYRFLKFEFIRHLPNVVGAGIWLVFLALILKKALQEKNVVRQVFLFFTGLIWGVYLFSPLHNLLSYEKYFDFVTPFLVISFVFVAEPLLNILSQKSLWKLLYIPLVIWVVGWSTPSFYRTIPMDRSWGDAVRIAERFSYFPIVTDCVNAPGFTYYLQQEIELFAFSENNCDLPVLAASYERVVYVAEFELDGTLYEERYFLDDVLESGYVKIGFLKSLDGIESKIPRFD